MNTNTPATATTTTREQLAKRLEEIAAKREAETKRFKEELDKAYENHRKEMTKLRDERQAAWKEYTELNAKAKTEKTEQLITEKAVKKTRKQKAAKTADAEPVEIENGVIDPVQA